MSLVSLSEFVLTFFNLPIFTARVPLPLLIIADEREAERQVNRNGRHTWYETYTYLSQW